MRTVTTAAPQISPARRAAIAVSNARDDLGKIIKMDGLPKEFKDKLKAIYDEMGKYKPERKGVLKEVSGPILTAPQIKAMLSSTGFSGWKAVKLEDSSFDVEDLANPAYFAETFDLKVDSSQIKAYVFERNFQERSELNQFLIICIPGHVMGEYGTDRSDMGIELMSNSDFKRWISSAG